MRLGRGGGRREYEDSIPQYPLDLRDECNLQTKFCPWVLEAFDFNGREGNEDFGRRRTLESSRTIPPSYAFRNQLGCDVYKVNLAWSLQVKYAGGKEDPSHINVPDEEES
uniref:Uncharacterized protein n=1 Tax=Ascaris lumbricoides TaxID=6252 RepID=A0A0M3IBJ4_ASCLU